MELKQAGAGRIPHLRIGKRYRFNRGKVAAVLAQRAAQRGEGVNHD